MMHLPDSTRCARWRWARRCWGVVRPRRSGLLVALVALIVSHSSSAVAAAKTHVSAETELVAIANEASLDGRWYGSPPSYRGEWFWVRATELTLRGVGGELGKVRLYYNAEALFVAASLDHRSANCQGDPCELLLRLGSVSSRGRRLPPVLRLSLGRGLIGLHSTSHVSWASPRASVVRREGSVSLVELRLPFAYLGLSGPEVALESGTPGFGERMDASLELRSGSTCLGGWPAGVCRGTRGSWKFGAPPHGPSFRLTPLGPTVPKVASVSYRWRELPNQSNALQEPPVRHEVDLLLARAPQSPAGKADLELDVDVIAADGWHGRPYRLSREQRRVHVETTSQRVQIQLRDDCRAHRLEWLGVRLALRRTGETTPFFVRYWTLHRPSVAERRRVERPACERRRRSWSVHAVASVSCRCTAPRTSPTPGTRSAVAAWLPRSRSREARRRPFSCDC